MSLKCNACGKNSTDLRPCSVCRRAHYCNRECQVGDWSKHKIACKVAAKGVDPDFLRPPPPMFDRSDAEDEERRRFFEKVEEIEEEETIEMRYERLLKAFSKYPSPKNREEALGYIDEMMAYAGVGKLSQEQRLRVLDIIIVASIEEQEATLALERELMLQANHVNATKRAEIAKYDKHCAQVAHEFMAGRNSDGLNMSGQFYGRLHDLAEEGLRMMGVEELATPPTAEMKMQTAAELYTKSYAIWNPLKKSFPDDPDLHDEPFSGDEEYDAIWSMSLDEFMPYITEAEDKLLWYPIHDDESGKDRLCARDEYNEIQKANRARAYRLANPTDEEVGERLEDFYASFPIQETLDVDGKFISLPNSRSKSPKTKSKERSPDAEPPLRVRPRQTQAPPAAGDVPKPRGRQPKVPGEAPKVPPPPKPYALQADASAAGAWNLAQGFQSLIQTHADIDLLPPKMTGILDFVAETSAQAQQAMFNRENSPTRPLTEQELAQIAKDKANNTIGFIKNCAWVAMLILGTLLTTVVIGYHNDNYAPGPSNRFLQEQRDKYEKDQEEEFAYLAAKLPHLAQGMKDYERQYGTLAFTAAQPLIKAMKDEEHNPGKSLWREVININALYPNNRTAALDHTMAWIHSMPGALGHIGVHAMSELATEGFLLVTDPLIRLSPRELGMWWKKQHLLTERDKTKQISAFLARSLDLAKEELNKAKKGTNETAIVKVEDYLADLDFVAEEYELSPDEDNVRRLISARLAALGPATVELLASGDVMSDRTAMEVLNDLIGTRNRTQLIDGLLGNVMRHADKYYKSSDRLTLRDPTLVLYENFKKKHFPDIFEPDKLVSRDSSIAAERLAREEEAMHEFLFRNPQIRYHLISIQRDSGIDPLMVNAYHVKVGTEKFLEKFKGNPEAVLDAFVTNPTDAQRALDEVNARLGILRAPERAYTNFLRYGLWKTLWGKLFIGNIVVGSMLSVFHLAFGADGVGEPSLWRDIDTSFAAIRSVSQFMGLNFATSYLAFLYLNVGNNIFRTFEYMDAFNAGEMSTSNWVYVLATSKYPQIGKEPTRNLVSLFLLGQGEFGYQIIALILSLGATYFIGIRTILPNLPGIFVALTRPIHGQIIAWLSDLDQGILEIKNGQQAAGMRRLALAGTGGSSRNKSTLFLAAVGALYLSSNFQTNSADNSSVAASCYNELNYTMGVFTPKYQDDVARSLVLAQYQHHREGRMALMQAVHALVKADVRIGKGDPRVEEWLMRVRWNWLPATQLPSPLSNRSFTDAEIDDVIKKLELYRNRTEARKRAVTFYTGT